MKLQNKNVHMRGKTILCNGTHYEIDANGAVDVSDGDATRLLAGREWTPCPPAGVAQDAPQRPQKPSQAIPKHQPDPTPPMAPLKSPEPAVVAALPGPVSEDDVPEISEEAGEGSGEEWPDPDMTMTKAYLQEMADAYEVEHNPSMTKKDLIEAILAKMYE